MPRFRFKTPVFSRLCGFCQLFPLDCRRWLRRAVEHNAVDLTAFVRDASRDGGEHVVRHTRPVGSHRVLRADRPQHDRRTVGAFVALHADGVHVGEQHDRALPDVAVETGQSHRHHAASRDVPS